MDYFMDDIACGIGESLNERLSEEDYGSSVWNRKKVIDFLENHLGLSIEKKLKGELYLDTTRRYSFGKN